MPLDALGYLGGLFEARFYQSHLTTDDPRDEIREAAALYGLDLAMMMSIAKVESDFDPRIKTGSYKGLFQLSDYEFKKYGDGNIWDARDNARAAAHMFLVQAEKFRWALGHYPDYAERYMVHQQGIQGAIEHYTHPERVAWQSMCATDEGMLKGEQWCKKCIWGNLLPKWKHAFGDVDNILILLSHNVAAFADEESCIWQNSLFSMRGAEMDLPKSGDATSRFLAFVEGLTSVIGHADRAKPLRDYCIGLMMPGERKSVEPMAAITAPERTAAQHQSLLHFVGEGTWSDEKVLAKVREMVLPEIERHGPIEAWIIDDTGFPKKGRHSVGVGRQYCGELGKQDNCQIAVTLSIANHHASLPAAYRLYLPKEWATDRTRRRKAGVPKEITFKTKPAIALEQLRWACVAGLPRGVVLMDAGYGAYTDLRTNITALGLSYIAGIMPQTSVWAPGTGPQPPKAWSGCGRPPKLLRRDGKHQPISVKKLAFGLPSKAWCKITWREATAEPLSSRFARVRVRAAHRDYWLAENRPEEWLLIEWPEGEEAPTKYWFSTLPANIAFHKLVGTAKLRWRIERDYQELKQEVGLGHFEGRGWRGFHHHATLCIAAYGFLISERETIPPSGTRSTELFKEITIPEAYRPRGSAIAA